MALLHNSTYRCAENRLFRWPMSVMTAFSRGGIAALACRRAIAW